MRFLKKQSLRGGTRRKNIFTNQKNHSIFSNNCVTIGVVNHFSRKEVLPVVTLLRKLRVSRGYSGSAVAALLRLNRARLSCVELRREAVSRPMRSKLAAFYDVAPGVLFDSEGLAVNAVD
jgi:hypothetical protein